MAHKIAGAALLLFLASGRSLTVQAPPCPSTTDSLVAVGLRALRADSLPQATAIWRRVIAACPRSVDARLTREIRESGAAGAIVFALLDEWFKKNWAVIDLEIPLDHTRKWHNLMDAEQNCGIRAMVAGDTATQPVLGGDVRQWRALAPTTGAFKYKTAGLSLRLGL